MITLEQYFGKFKPEHVENAEKLLSAVNALMSEAILDGIEFRVNPVTKSQVSGAQYGGFRPLDCPIGAPNSSHKQAMAVDLYDPKDEIDAWCVSHLDKLEIAGIYIEHPDDTKTWSHWTIRPPKSGSRVFKP